MIELFRFIILSVRFFFSSTQKIHKKKIVDNPSIDMETPPHFIYSIYILRESLTHYIPSSSLLRFEFGSDEARGTKKCFCAIDNECARLNSSSWTSKDTFFLFF